MAVVFQLLGIFTVISFLFNLVLMHLYYYSHAGQVCAKDGTDLKRESEIWENGNFVKKFS